MLNLILGVKVFGNPDDLSCTKIADYDGLSSGKPEKGSLTVLVSLIRATDIMNAEVLAERLLEKLRNSYFDSNLDTLSSLRASLENVQKEFKNWLSKLEIVTSVYVEGILYSAVLGNGEVAILRGPSFAKILTGLGGVVVASGYPEEGDLLLLGTKDFFNGSVVTLIKENIGDLVLVQEELTKLVLTNPRSTESGGAILSFSQKLQQSEVIPNQEESTILFKPTTKLVDRIPGFKSIFAKIIPKRQIYLRGEETEEKVSNRKTTITVGIILLVLLVISIGFGVRQRSIKLAKARYQDKLNEALHDFDEANSLISLDESRSQELFSASSSIANDLKSQGVKDPDLTDLLQKIDSTSGSILKEYKPNLDNFVDLGLLTDGFKGTDLASSGEEMFVLDKNSRKIIEVSILNKMSKVVAGPGDFDSGNQIASFEDKSYVLGDSGVWQLGNDKKNIIPKDWSGEVLFYNYGGNLYVLDKAGAKLWRYSAIQSGFAAKQNWFGAGIAPNLDNIVSWAIDGNVWLLSSSGRVSRFSLGSPQSFSISGLGMGLSSPTSLYTNPDLQDIYILDPRNSRMIVIDKKGVYKAQYISEGLKTATDLVVSEKDKKAVFLINGNLKSIDLKHL